MIYFKATRANLTAHAKALDAHADKSLTAWIITGQADKFQRVKEAARMLKQAAALKRISDRLDFLRDVDATF